MLKTVDVGLMANHLSAHHAIVNRLQFFMNYTQNPQIISILEKQILMMKNHVQVMNQLLDPKQMQVILPPIPNSNGKQIQQKESTKIDLTEHDMVVDAHFTASSMAKENFNSSENMRDKQVKQIHSEMALQQSMIAEMYETIMTQMGWMKHPNATVQEQSSAIMPLNMEHPLHQNQQMNHPN